MLRDLQSAGVASPLSEDLVESLKRSGINLDKPLNMSDPPNPELSRRIRMCTSIIRMNQMDEHCLQTRIFLDALIEFLCSTEYCREEGSSAGSHEGRQVLPPSAPLNIEATRIQKDYPPQPPQPSTPQGIENAGKVDPDSSSVTRFDGHEN